MKNLSNTEWRQQLKEDNNAIIVDVRTLEEVEEGIIPNALHIDIYDSSGFMSSIQNMDKTKNYYVYCRSGARSKQACMLMAQFGIENTYNLTTGFSKWDGEISML